MNRRRWALLVVLFFGAIWLLWVKPKTVDMAQFAPANSLIYIEVNEPVQLLKTLSKTEAWILLNQHLDAPALSYDSRWQEIFRLTGIGPIDSVLLSRSQMALVVTSLGATETGDVLTVKPEAALIVETHTSEGRIRAPIVRHLQQFVAATYKNPSQEHRVIDGISTVEFKDNSESGQLIAAFVGSVVVIGNSKSIVENCVGVARRRTPSLRTDPQLQSARTAHSSADELVFGYVPGDGSSKLLAAAVPMLLGQSPNNLELQRLVQNASAKLIGAVTWSTRSFRGGIEDRYSVELQPDVVSELTPQFGIPHPITPSDLNPEVYSITSYRFANPFASWQSLKTSVSRRVDAVAAVLFNTTLKTSLSSYGIDDPETFLAAVKSPLKTVRLDAGGDRQLLVATVADIKKLETLFEKSMRLTGKSSDEQSTSIMENLDQTLSVLLNESVVIIGHPVDVQQYYRIHTELGSRRNEASPRITNFIVPESRAHIVTYTNDGERIRAVATAIAKANHKEIPSTMTEKINALPYAMTETTLTERGLTRITRSPLGQFATLIPLLIANEAGR